MHKFPIRIVGFGKYLFITTLLVLLSSQCDKKSTADTTGITATRISYKHAPLFIDPNANNELAVIHFTVNEGSSKIDLKKITLRFTSNSNLHCISAVSVNYTGAEPGISTSVLFGKSTTIASSTEISGVQQLGAGTHVFRVLFDGNLAADMLSSFEIKDILLETAQGTSLQIIPDESYKFHVAKTLRAAGQDACNTYRIPGIITTEKGTLIAIYDNRYASSTDLQGNIDIGMSRSTDGGNTWQPMKVIMDMGEWGGKPQSENGIGDPCVLYDPTTHTIWVAALWAHGNPGKMIWNSSKPGLEPAETGQLMLVKSSDDGLTWSLPINITSQVKNPAWNLFFQGPGMGITLQDGTLVFPAQFKDASAVPYSTIIYSKDHGATWAVGTGAKPNTTEAQVVQLANGQLMLNMRDDLNRTEKGPYNGRAVSITNDLGKTWITHATSNSALPEPNCMASIISANVNLNGKMQQVLLFSNPNDKFSRTKMTIKASLDQGETWPAAYQYEYYAPECYGYSCLTMVDENTLGVLYEGTKSLIFQKIPVSSVLKGVK